MLAGNVVSSSYFNAMNMKLTPRPAFGEDPKARGCRVAVINQEAAELYFGGDAIGGAVIDGAGRRTEIVGVVQSALLRSSQRREEATIYFPMDQDFRPRMTLVMATTRAPRALLASVQRQLATLSGGNPSVLRVMTLDEHLSRTALASERISTLLVGACAAIALGLGMLGLSGAMGDAVRHRRREIALRLALGAPRWRISYQLFVEGLGLAVVATIAGTIGALVVKKWLAVTAPASGAFDILIWLTAPIALVLAVVISSLLPMRRAITVNPVTLLQRN